MFNSSVGIVYSLSQRKRRRVIIPFDPKAILQNGEALLQQSIEDYNLRGPDAAVEDIAGNPLSDRCVLVDPKSLSVISVLHADPQIDIHPQGTLVQHDLADLGDIQVGNTFMRSMAIYDANSVVTQIISVDVNTISQLSQTQFLASAIGLSIGQMLPVAATLLAINTANPLSLDSP